MEATKHVHVEELLCVCGQFSLSLNNVTVVGIKLLSCHLMEVFLKIVLKLSWVKLVSGPALNSYIRCPWAKGNCLTIQLLLLASVNNADLLQVYWAQLLGFVCLPFKITNWRSGLLPANLIGLEQSHQCLLKTPLDLFRPFVEVSLQISHNITSLSL